MSGNASPRQLTKKAKGVVLSRKLVSYFMVAYGKTVILFGQEMQILLSNI